MAKYLLGSVGTAEAFRIRNDKAELAFVAKTLTSSSLNVSIEKEELRAGTGAPIVAQFYHSPNVEITLEDVFFKKEYMESQLGATFDDDDHDAYISETVMAVNNKLVVSGTPHSLGFACIGETVDTILWATKQGEDDWKAYDVSGHETVSGTFENGKTYCVRYYGTDADARKAIVKSNFVPEELMLVITTPIFAGDACAASKSTIAGSLTFRVPRFKLNGGQEFNFEAASTFNMSLSGVALAVSEGCDAINSTLFEIIEVITDRASQGLVGIKLAGGTSADELTTGDGATVYAIYENGTTKLITDMTTLTSSAPSILKVVDDGFVYGVSAGPSTLTYTPSGSVASKTLSVTVSPA